eukprot:TRINITY_DN967_c0_g1_i1.p1 TRINITY_DN967_c0_g1~~TRINITY_DN967_c0_g1_i1.p1  ORF type:complete len:535 (+),score=120.52 TRINITY_DN967_c0_g1_i1:162-1766(+)
MHKYRLLSKKGEGTFSEVLKAQSIKSNKHVAIKCMKNHFDSIDQVNNLREIQALRRLAGHPNIIKLLEILYDEPTGRLALVFELMDMNVYEAIKGRRHYLPEAKTKHWTYELCKALDHMHRNGIFHRDVKPENLLLLDDEIKLADLGSCRGIYSRQPFTEYISTRWYRAPECLLTDGYYGFKMDLFAAGCVWFEIVALFPLFPGQNEMDQIQKIHNVLGTPSPELLASKFKRNASHMDFNFQEKKGTGIERLIPHADPELVELMKKLLRYDPDERILARQALKDPFFREYHERDKKESAPALPSHMPPSGGSGASAARSREQWFTKAANASSSSTATSVTTEQLETPEQTTQTDMGSSIGGGAVPEEGRSGGLPNIGQSVRRKPGGGGGGGGAAGGGDSEDDGGPGQMLPPIGGLKKTTGRANVKQQTFKTAANAALHSSTQGHGGGKAFGATSASKTMAGGMHGRGNSKSFGTTFGGSGHMGPDVTATSSKSNVDGMSVTNPQGWTGESGMSARSGSNVVASMGSTWAPQRRR